MALAYKHLAQREDGRVHIAGRRLTPYDMLRQYELGCDAERIAEGYELTLAEVFESLAYAYGHLDEMAAIHADNEAAMRHVTEHHTPEQFREQLRQSDEEYRKWNDDTVRKVREKRLGSDIPG